MRRAYGVALLFVFVGSWTGCGPSPDARAPSAAAASPEEPDLPTCAAGEALDLAHRVCLPADRVREVASEGQIVADEDEVMTCGEGVLAVTRDADGARALDCIPAKSTCRSGAWREGGCVRAETCRAPTAREASRVADGRGHCLALATAPSVDVATWARARLGIDGGDVEPTLCAELERAPRALGLSPSRETRVDFAFDLRFEDNDVTRAALVWRARVGGHAIDAAASEAVAHEIDARVAELRARGGSARAASLHVDASCTLRGLGGPVTRPRREDRGG